MSAPTKQPNTELAIHLLADGHDARSVRRFANFPSMASVRAFIRDSDVLAAVDDLVRERTTRVRVKALMELERLLDSESTDGRTRVAAARACLEASGHMHRRDQLPPVKRVHELTLAELETLIASTRRELEAREAQRALPHAN